MTINEFAKEYYNLNPVSFRTKDENRLKKQQEKLLGTCPICKQLMSYIPGTNVVVCKNPSCKGREKEITLKDGSTIKRTESSSRLLHNNAVDIAQIIFNE